MPGDIESPDVSGRYYHSEYEASDLEIDASPHYPPQHTPPVFITNEKEDTAAAKQQSTSKDVDTNNKEFSFAML